MAQRPHIPATAPVVLFSYGTLQHLAVQDGVLGHRPDGWADEVPGHRLDWITITNPDVIRLSGTDRHPALVPDAGGATVSGTAWHLTGRDLAATDAYEVEDYTRVQVTLSSGLVAWVYTLATDQQGHRG